MLVSVPTAAFAQTQVQVEKPDRRYLFLEDKYKKQTDKAKRQELKRKQKAAAAKQSLGEILPFDINAATLNYDSTGSVATAEGGVIITYSSLVAEADRARVDIQKNEADMSGDVRISDITSNLLADWAHLNFESGHAQMNNVEVFFADGDYRLFAAQADRQPGDSYTLKDAVLSTCQCPDDDRCLPWSLRAKEAEITRNGYGETWDTTLAVNDVPVFYFPYLIFPAKTERQSGLLPASFGGGRKSGLDFQLPLFLALNESSDMTLTMDYESNVHIGGEVEYRRIFSRRNELETGHIYLNESARDGDLLGTNTDGLYDDSIDANRYGGYLNHSWSGSSVQYLMRGRYVSDDLFVREYESDNIAPYNARFVTSQAALRAPLAGSFSADLSAEYNQSLITNDDLELQRLPELNIAGTNTFRPFGENPLGMSLVSTTNLSSVYFTRTSSYTGNRSEAYERLKFPFHVRNYFDGSFEANVRATSYSLTDNVIDPADPVYDSSAADNTFPDSSTRLLPSFIWTLNSVVEKVFPVSDENLIKKLADLGASSRTQELVRLKHTIEPGIKYRVTPFVDQSDNPLFDDYDHLAQRNVLTYGLTQRLYGRYDPRNEYVYGIEETAPEIEDIGGTRSPSLLDPAFAFGLDDSTAESGDYRPLRQGSIAELANLKLFQSYDVLEAERNADPAREPLSDLGGAVTLFPNEHVILRSDTNYSIEDNTFSSYSIQGMLKSKRGDTLRSGLRFVEENIRQLESGLELQLTEHSKLGYYSRYDDLSGEFIEQKGGLRFFSSCRCWIFDVIVTDKINPDETKIGFNVTLVGLGEVGNSFFAPTSKTRDEQNGN
ncbi:MAG TPA: LPS assembly protein LptD [Oligoflexia bacterium]|nr:LPS assembly protein LptD [Oligoflexia bacterium]